MNTAYKILAAAETAQYRFVDRHTFRDFTKAKKHLYLGRAEITALREDALATPWVKDPGVPLPDMEYGGFKIFLVDADSHLEAFVTI